MQYEAQKKQLLEKQQELLSRLASIKKDLQKAYNADSSEQATERENDEVLEALANNCQHEVQLVAKALQRLEEGSYGFCISCGEAINESRLEATPHVELCMDCAQ